MSNPTPKLIKKAKGTLKPSRDIDEPEPNIMNFSPQPPSKLNARAKEIWQEIVPQLISLQIFTNIDYKLIVAYCKEMELYERATENCETKGYVGLYGKNNYPMKNPWIDVGNRALDNIIRISKEFGLSPAARTKISVSKSQPKGIRASIQEKIK